jgi:hypothetical protein
MRPDSITLAIFEQYNPEEKAKIADQLAQAQADMETVELEKKASDSAFNDRIKQHATSVSTLAKQYNKGGETAQIGCDIRYDNPEPGKKSYFRMDRVELVETHDMNWEEKQETIQFPLAEAGEAPAPTADQVAQSLSGIEAATPPTADIEEVTRICPYPGCILFAEHEGDHNFPPADVAPADAPAPEAQPQKERKAKRIRLPPDEPESPDAQF